jgi:hypothetical protein
LLCAFGDEGHFFCGLSGDWARTADTASPAADADTWAHWALTTDADSLQLGLWKDGASLKLAPDSDADGRLSSSSSVAFSSQLHVGTCVGSSDVGGTSKWDPFTGSMDELRVYRGVVLDAAGIASAMGSVSTSEAGLISYLAFDDPGRLHLNYVSSTSCDGTSTAVPVAGKMCGAEPGGVALEGGGCCPLVVEGGTVSCTKVNSPRLSEHWLRPPLFSCSLRLSPHSPCCSRART